VQAGIAAGSVLLVVAGVVLLLTTHPLAPISAATPTPSATGPVAQTGITAAVADRMRFVVALQAGDRAGVLDYLSTHARFLPAELRTTSRAASTEYSGQGSSAITLDPSELAEHGGRMTVIVVTDRAATFSWQAQPAARSSGAAATLASHAGSAPVGEPVTSTFEYARHAPARLALFLDETVKWGVVVVFTD